MNRHAVCLCLTGATSLARTDWADTGASDPYCIVSVNGTALGLICCYTPLQIAGVCTLHGKNETTAWNVPTVSQPKFGTVSRFHGRNYLE